MPIYFTLHAIVVGLDYHQRLERLQCAWNGSPVVPDQNNACGIVLHLFGLSPPPRPPCPRPPHYFILLFFIHLLFLSSFPLPSRVLLSFSLYSFLPAGDDELRRLCIDTAKYDARMVSAAIEYYTHTCTIST